MFEKKSAKNRMFFDSLVRAIFCECKQPFPNRRPHERYWWLDIELPSYRSVMRNEDKNAIYLGTNTSKMGFDTPR